MYYNVISEVAVKGFILHELDGSFDEIVGNDNK
jgi:hypothetical protein